MAEGETRSLHHLERETEATRASLRKTVDQLRDTVTDTAGESNGWLRPEAIKAEISDFFKSRGEQLLSDVNEAARRNPIHVMAGWRQRGLPTERGDTADFEMGSSRDLR